MSILEVQHIEKHFGATRVLNDISFSLEKGQALSIIGASGSGKTTLLRCLNFLERPDHGTIAVNGNVIFDAKDPSTQSEKEIRKKRLHFGLVFQNFNLFPQYTALQNVTLARELMAKEHGHESKAQIMAHGMELLEQTRCAMRELPDTDREILELRHFEELSNTECAAALGIDVKAASIRYVRALKRMKDIMERVAL